MLRPVNWKLSKHLVHQFLTFRLQSCIFFKNARCQSLFLDISDSRFSFKGMDAMVDVFLLDFVFLVPCQAGPLDLKHLHFTDQTGH